MTGRQHFRCHRGSCRECQMTALGVSPFLCERAPSPGSRSRPRQPTDTHRLRLHLLTCFNLFANGSFSIDCFVTKKCLISPCWTDQVPNHPSDRRPLVELLHSKAKANVDPDRYDVAIYSRVGYLDSTRQEKVSQLGTWDVLPYPHRHARLTLYPYSHRNRGVRSGEMRSCQSHRHRAPCPENRRQSDQEEQHSRRVVAVVTLTNSSILLFVPKSAVCGTFEKCQMHHITTRPICSTTVTQDSVRTHNIFATASEEPSATQ